MDISTTVGLVIGLGGVLLGNLLEGGQVASLLQGTAALIVFLGTLGATVVANGIQDVRAAFALFLRSFRESREARFKRAAGEIMVASNTARRESLMVLETKINGFSFPYLKNAFRFMIDGIEPDALRKIFESEIRTSEARLMQLAKVWSDAGGFAPTIGILGAVLGLIHVMANLSDTTALGKGIAVAFVATIYGVGSANLIFIPISNRLKRRIREETELKKMMMEGVLGIASGMSPYVVEEKVRTYTDLPKGFM